MKRMLVLLALMAFAATALLLAGCHDYSSYEKCIVGKWYGYSIYLEQPGKDRERINKLYIVNCTQDHNWTITFNDEVLYEGTWDIKAVTKPDSKQPALKTIVECNLRKKGSNDCIGSIRYVPEAAEFEKQRNAYNYPNVSASSEDSIEDALQHLHRFPMADYFTLKLTLDDGSQMEVNCEHYEWVRGSSA